MYLSPLTRTRRCPEQRGPGNENSAGNGGLANPAPVHRRVTPRREGETINLEISPSDRGPDIREAARPTSPALNLLGYNKMI